MPGPLPTTSSVMPSGLGEVRERPAKVPRSAVATLTPPRKAAPKGCSCRIGEPATGVAAPGVTSNTRTVPPRLCPTTIWVVPAAVTLPAAISRPPVYPGPKGKKLYWGSGTPVSLNTRT